MLNNQFKKGELYSFITGKASTAVARRMQRNFKESGINITIEQWSVLYHLWKEDGQSQQQLCWPEAPAICTQGQFEMGRCPRVRQKPLLDIKRINQGQ